MYAVQLNFPDGSIAGIVYPVAVYEDGEYAGDPSTIDCDKAYSFIIDEWNHYLVAISNASRIPDIKDFIDSNLREAAHPFDGFMALACIIIEVYQP